MKKSEVCLEINHEVEQKILEIDQQYLDGLIFKNEMANKVAWLIREYLFENELVLFPQEISRPFGRPVKNIQIKIEISGIDLGSEA